MEITIEKIRKFDLVPGDVVILDVEVGKMPPQRVRQYLEQVRESMKEKWPENIPFMLNTMRDGVPSVLVSIVHAPVAKDYLRKL